MIKSTITEAVKTDLDTRTAKGIKEYGRPLSKYMGEDGLKHAYEEALDLAQYLKLRLMEEATPYQCYWKDRALAAEKKLAERSTGKVDAIEPAFEQTFTIEEFAAKISYHPESVRRSLRNGSIKGVRYGRRWHIKHSELIRYMNEGSLPSANA